ncbi:hypothetical protein GCM10027570_10920 [Streptomonospora sediminis]
MPTTYRVRALRWKGGWELHIDGVGATQTRRLTAAGDMARDYIARALGIEDIDDLNVLVEDADTDATAVGADQVRRDARAKGR